ncbi:nuclear transport factor 2 family protein [Streptomyces sp. PKU-EA00015]|uniref:nuclear transport factor 2 family protein n=1 Tax=Streptomyces sp. PKU-EA00015 TaxID=2748326 RepID=UPI0015A00CED|nr:nuclear transport factor 2 family protein [Streptomyces sp. PKU-EA00015]NWF29592.1 nuclear transport factor 2 family protein [Streptomyces sp. PKU-EA00015]
MKTIRRAAAPVIGVLAGAAAVGVFLGGNATATEGDSPNDRFAIREVIDRHQMHIDLRDADGYANLYAKDGSYRSPFGSADGRSEIKAMFIDLAEKGFTKGKRHMTGPAVIEVNGTTATARSWYWVAETEAEHAVYATGTYTDKLRKVNGKWEIVQRVQTLDELAPDGR